MLAGGAVVALVPVVKFVPALQAPVEALRRYSFSDLMIETLNNYRDEFAANVLQHNPLLAHFNKGREPIEPPPSVTSNS